MSDREVNLSIVDNGTGPSKWPHKCPLSESPCIEETTEGRIQMPGESNEEFAKHEQWQWKCHECGAYGGRKYKTGDTYTASHTWMALDKGQGPLNNAVHIAKSNFFSQFGVKANTLLLPKTQEIVFRHSPCIIELLKYCDGPEQYLNDKGECFKLPEYLFGLKVEIMHTDDENQLKSFMIYDTFCVQLPDMAYITWRQR